MAGKVVGIYIAEKKGEVPGAVNSVKAVAHRGLMGDRYFTKSGTYSGAEPIGPGREVTLIEEENVSLLKEHIGRDVDPGIFRRNVVTHGINLNDLVGKQFTVGNITLLGVRLCHPCAHLAQLTGIDVIKYLKDKGGLRADILNDGVLNKGDKVGF